MSKEDSYMDIPETYSRRYLNTLYREIPLKYTTSRTLRKYFNAMANLYGTITLKDAWKIISKQSPYLVTKEEFLAFAEIARHECECYYLLSEEEMYADGSKKPVWERKIIDVALFNEDISLYHETLCSHQGKDYYVPEKNQFFRYEDPYYCEDTPEAQALKQFLGKTFSLDEDKVNAIFTDILCGTRINKMDLSDILDRFDELGLEFTREEDFDIFIAIYQQFHNHTRKQCNRGHTPDELFQRLTPEKRMPKYISFGPNIRKSLTDGTIDANELREGFRTMELPSEELRVNLLKELADAEAAAKTE